MTDYDYNNHRVTLDDNDSSKNGAQDISGYDLDVNPDPHWPGTAGSKRTQRHDVEKMRAVSKQIGYWIQTLNNNAGGSNSISGRVAGTSFGDQSWAAAQYLSKANDSAAATIDKFTGELIKSLTAAQTAIDQAANKYEATEKANKQSAQNQQNNLDEI